MTSALRTLTIVLLIVAALLSFGWLVRRISFISIGLAANEESREMLHRSLADQKRLARLDPSGSAAYRHRYDQIRLLTKRMEVLDLTRRELTRRIEVALLGTVAAILAIASVMYFLEHRAREQRIAQIGAALEALSRGDTDITITGRRSGILGRIASMIEETSTMVAADRRRVMMLEHLASWQDAARRLAHEIRTPLTVAQLELDRFARTIGGKHPETLAYVEQTQGSIRHELMQLASFTDEFASFARIGEPRMRNEDLVFLARDFVATFATHWTNATLIAEARAASCEALIDREMFRQVLVNLCKNSARAAAPGPVTVRLITRCDPRRATLDVCDDGPGMPDPIRRRIFEPYNTTRRGGEGLGLGLAIAKKIMLDHGGDLELVGGGKGTTFRLIFSREAST